MFRFTVEVKEMWKTYVNDDVYKQQREKETRMWTRSVEEMSG